MIGQNISTTFRPRMGARRPRMKGAQPNTIQPSPSPQTGKGGFGGSVTNPTPIPGQPATPAPTTAPPFNDPTAPRTPPPAQPPPAAGPPPSHGNGGKGDFGGSVRDPHPVTPDSPITHGTAPEPSIDDLIEQNIRKYMSGGDDTEAEQKALADQENAALSHALVNQRARMGRAGFGSSGALAGMENDARSAAARQLALDQIGIREREQQQGFDRFQGAAGTDIDERRLAQEQADADARLAFLKTIVGGGPGATPDAGGGADAITGLTGDQERQGAINRAPVTDAVDPAWGKPIASDAAFDVYEYPKGVYHRVRKDKSGSSSSSRDNFMDQVSGSGGGAKVPG